MEPANYPVDTETGYPIGFGSKSQDVLMPSFLSAYKGSDPENGEYRHI